VKLTHLLQVISERPSGATLILTTVVSVCGCAKRSDVTDTPPTVIVRTFDCTARVAQFGIRQAIQRDSVLDQQGLAELRVTIRSLANDEPLYRSTAALYRVANPNSPMVAGALSDSFGTVALRAAADTYNLRVEYIGYRGGVSSVVMRRGFRDSVTVRIDPAVICQ
jgi:hypothetical protein